MLNRILVFVYQVVINCLANGCYSYFIHTCGFSILIAILCHNGNLRVEHRNARDALAGTNRRIVYQAIDNHGRVVRHFLQVLVNGHGLLTVLDIFLRFDGIILTGNDRHVCNTSFLQSRNSALRRIVSCRKNHVRTLTRTIVGKTILHGFLWVYYASADTISDTLAYDMGQEREFNYANMNIDEAIRHLTRFCANLWQKHAFCEGNTRTTAVFMIKYLRTLGFNVVNDVFAENSWYFRNALVRANYSDLTAGISETTLYLERFFRSMLLGEEHDLRNRIMHVDWGNVADEATPQSANNGAQSAKLSDELPPKCKNCTLEEVAVLRMMHENPSATQKEIAAAIGKSERTVKTITVALQEKLIVKRVNGKRNGYWEFIV